jgi:hypothetical protein
MDSPDDLTNGDETGDAPPSPFGPLDLRSPVDHTDRPDEIAVARNALEPVRRSLAEAGFYAYGTLDDQHRWTVAVDDEAGRVDVRVGPDGFVVELWASSPGLYADEENEWRRRALERLARMTIPNISRGLLKEHQSAEWDEIDHGVAVRIRYELPFTQGETIGAFVRSRLPELDELLSFVESRVTS